MKEHLIKKALFAKCEAFVSEKIDSLERGLESHQKALASETKSSAGDKHETGRAMLQLEMEKSGQATPRGAATKSSFRKNFLATTVSGYSVGKLGDNQPGHLFPRDQHGNDCAPTNNLFCHLTKFANWQFAIGQANR